MVGLNIEEITYIFAFLQLFGAIMYVDAKDMLDNATKFQKFKFTLMCALPTIVTLNVHILHALGRW